MHMYNLYIQFFLCIVLYIKCNENVLIITGKMYQKCNSQLKLGYHYFSDNFTK